MVTAVDKATGRSFQFSVRDTPLLKSLRPGQAVYADFAKGQVSVDPNGKTPCCNIVGLSRGGRSSNVPAVSNAERTAASAPSLGSAESDISGLRVEVRELKRTGKSVTLRFTMFNDGSSPFDIGQNFGGNTNVNGVTLLDPLTNKSYSVLGTTDCMCSTGLHTIAARSKINVWAKFEVPPEVQKATVVIPHFTPIEDVPIASGGQ
jgi:hypothetical protein